MGPNPLQNPLIPPVMPPPSAAHGFQVFASDPRNAMTIQPSMTAPNAPLQPNAGMAAANPPKPPPMASSMPPAAAAPPQGAQPSTPAMLPSYASQQQPLAAKLGTDQQELQRLQANGAGTNQIQNKWGRGLAKAGDIALSVLSPGIATLVPGTMLHNSALQSRQDQKIAQDQASIKSAADLADTQSQTAERTAKGAKEGAQAESYAPITLSAQQASAIGHPELEGQELNSKAYSLMLQGKQRTDSAETIADGKNSTATSIASGKDQTAKQIADEKAQTAKGIADAKNKTQTLLQGMKDSTSASNTSARIAGKGTTGGASYKVPADITKRAALSSNVLENADAVENIINQHPEIVGAAGGRFTNVQQMIGSNDPNINALGVRMHNIALASNGAHGLRSAEAVAQTEKELFNNFKTGPQGIKGGLQAIRGSVQTFLDDEKNFSGSGKRNPMQSPTTSKADPLGIR